MAYGRNDRDYPFRSRDDDRRQLAGRWTQDNDTGSLRRSFDDDGPGDQAYRDGRDRESRDYDDWRNRGNAGGYYGEPDRRRSGNGGHAFDFARRDSDRTGDGGREDDRPPEGEDRFGDPMNYGIRQGGRFDRSYSRDRAFSDASPRGGWQQDDNRIGRYVSAEGRADESRLRSGSFRGRGPKGYVRSDERIREDVSDRLSDDDTLDASDITVDISGGEVTLSGSVDSRQAKHTAEDCAEQCAGVTHVQNNLRVRTAGNADQGSVRSEAGEFAGKTKTTDL